MWTCIGSAYIDEGPTYRKLLYNCGGLQKIHTHRKKRDRLFILLDLNFLFDEQEQAQLATI